jgi:hypothetical protein
LGSSLHPVKNSNPDTLRIVKVLFIFILWLEELMSRKKSKTLDG